MKGPHSLPAERGIEQAARRKDGAEFPVEISLGSQKAHRQRAVSAVTGVRRGRDDEWYCSRVALATAQQSAADVLRWLAKFPRECAGTRLRLLDQIEFRRIGCSFHGRTRTMNHSGP